MYHGHARITVRTRPTPNVHRRERRYHVKKSCTLGKEMKNAKDALETFKAYWLGDAPAV